MDAKYYCANITATLNMHTLDRRGPVTPSAFGLTPSTGTKMNHNRPRHLLSFLVRCHSHPHPVCPQCWLHLAFWERGVEDWITRCCWWMGSYTANLHTARWWWWWGGGGWQMGRYRSSQMSLNLWYLSGHHYGTNTGYLLYSEICHMSITFLPFMQCFCINLPGLWSCIIIPMSSGDNREFLSSEADSLWWSVCSLPCWPWHLTDLPSGRCGLLRLSLPYKWKQATLISSKQTQGRIFIWHLCSPPSSEPLTQQQQYM